MSYELSGSDESRLNQKLLDEIHALKKEIQHLKARLEDAEELKRAISEGDLDALVIYRPEGELVFTLDSADRAYRVLVETMNEGTATLACDGSTILYCNRRFAELLKKSPQTVVGTSVYEFITPENISRFKSLLNRDISTGEVKFQTEVGTDVPVYLSVSSLNPNGSPNAWCIVATDLTERKKNENVLANFEIARQREIHHRIKNNLQVISSLLDLEAEKFYNRKVIKNSEVLEAFKKSRDRVISIALIHEELHKDGEKDALNFSLYLEKLAENLFQTYKIGTADIDLNLDLKQKVFFNMDVAVPLGMIVNELITNSLKYAFRGRDKGEIRIKLFSEEIRSEPDNKEESTLKNTGYTLTVSDDGSGISGNINFEKPDTLGLQLVNILVDQLDGNIEINRDKGTEFRIRINLLQHS